MRPNGCQSNRVSESSNWSIKIPNIFSLAKWFVYRKHFLSSTFHKCLKNGRFSDENILILRHRRSIEWDSRTKYEQECGASKKPCMTKVKLYPDNFEITRRASITDTGFCMIHYLHIHLPVYFDLPVQPEIPSYPTSVWRNVCPNSFNGLRPEFSFLWYRIRFWRWQKSKSQVVHLN